MLSSSAQPQTVRGVVTRIIFNKPDKRTGKEFSCAMVRVSRSQEIKVVVDLRLFVGDDLHAFGAWENGKYGWQFVIDRVHYGPPPDSEGLRRYLAKNRDFLGVGDVAASKLVALAPTVEVMNLLLQRPPAELHAQTGIPLTTLETLVIEWPRAGKLNAVRVFLANIGLSAAQVKRLVERRGVEAEEFVRDNPFALIEFVPLGFEKADRIARRLGVSPMDPRRVEEGAFHALQESSRGSRDDRGGHTWAPPEVFFPLALKALCFRHEDIPLIRSGLDRLVEHGRAVRGDTWAATSLLYNAEKTIYQALKEHAFMAAEPPPGWEDHQEDLLGEQKAAYELAMRHRIVALCGIAGSGKTFVLSRLTAAFQEAGLEVAVCSFTGKAAQRAKASLLSYGVDNDASTIHRLLHSDGEGHFQRDSLSEEYEVQIGPDEDDEDDFVEYPACDVVIVDEASMVSAKLLASLIERIDFEDTRLVFIGDHNQLPPIEPGNSLRDMLRHKYVPSIVLGETVRQAGMLKQNSAAVLRRELPPSAGDDPCWQVRGDFASQMDIQRFIRGWMERKEYTKLGLDFRDVQILTPQHDGAAGTIVLNKMIQEMLLGKQEREFTIGDRVIQTSNDYQRGVMNGTVGVIRGYDPEEGYEVDFDMVGPRVMDPVTLKLAYALTVHKAQGAEFPFVIVLCHHSFCSFLLTRNLLYTAVTRASKYLLVLGSDRGFQQALRTDGADGRRTFLNSWGEYTRQENS